MATRVPTQRPLEKCPACGYSLVGMRDRCCPECGVAVAAAALTARTGLAWAAAGGGVVGGMAAAIAACAYLLVGVGRQTVGSDSVSGLWFVALEVLTLLLSVLLVRLAATGTSRRAVDVWLGLLLVGVVCTAASFWLFIRVFVAR